jgi:hypothetical protein
MLAHASIYLFASTTGLPARLLRIAAGERWDRACSERNIICWTSVGS